MLDLHLDNVKRISPGFWGAIAGAAAAGATVFSGNRIVGALVLGGGMFLVALQLTPCCEGCAQGQGCGDKPATSTPANTNAPAPAPNPLATVRAVFRDQQLRRDPLASASNANVGGRCL